MNTSLNFYVASGVDGFGVAFSPPEVDAVDLIPFEGVVTTWTPLELTMRFGEWEGPLGDYVNTNVVMGRVCSRRLKELLESLRSEFDVVQWLPAFVTDLQGKRTEHFVLHFPEPPDVLNLEPGETIYHDCDNGQRILIRPTISRAKAAKHNLFNIRGFYILTIVREDVKCAIEAAGMQGIEFSPIRTRD